MSVKKMPPKKSQKPRRRKNVTETNSVQELAIRRAGLGTPTFKPVVLIQTYRRFLETQSPVQIYRFVRMICEHPSFEALPYRMKNFFRKNLPTAKLAAQDFTARMGQRLREGKPPLEYPK